MSEMAQMAIHLTIHTSGSTGKILWVPIHEMCSTGKKAVSAMLLIICNIRYTGSLSCKNISN